MLVKHVHFVQYSGVFELRAGSVVRVMNTWIHQSVCFPSFSHPCCFLALLPSSCAAKLRPQVGQLNSNNNLFNTARYNNDFGTICASHRKERKKKNVKSISLERIQWLNRFACYGVIEWETASLNLIIYLLHNNRKLMDGVRKWGGRCVRGRWMA